MGKDTTGHKKGNSDDENWRTQHRSNSREFSTKKLTTGTSRVPSSPSLSSSSLSNGHRREAGNGSSSSSASSSRSSSTTSVPKSVLKESHISSGNSHSRRNKRMRTKSGRKHHDEAVKTTSLETCGDRRHSPNSSGRSSRRKGEDDKSKHRHEPKGYSADEDVSWRKSSSKAGTSSTKQLRKENSPKDNSKPRHGILRTDQRESHQTVHRESGDKNAKMQPPERSIEAKDQDGGFEGSDEKFDFASDVFKKSELRNAKNIKSSSAKKADLMKDARSQRLLKLSDDRRKKEYVGYQPTYVHKLYSYGIDNKGKKEPQKTDLSKKEEDMMFRKRAVYMMHLEEERKRKEREDKEAERNGISKSHEKNMKNVSEKLKEAVRKRIGVHDWQRGIKASEPARRETMVKETNRLLNDLEAALPDTSEMETIPEAINEGLCSSDCDGANPTKHQFAEALSLRSMPDKPGDSESSSSPTNMHLEPEKIELNFYQVQSDTKEFQQEKGKEDKTTSSVPKISSTFDAFETNGESANANTISDHDDDLIEEDVDTEGGEGKSKTHVATDERMADQKTTEVKRDGGLNGKHGGLPPVISDHHHRDNGKVLAASRKENVISISPETVRKDQQDSSSGEVVSGSTQQLEKISTVRNETATSSTDVLRTTSVQGGDLNKSSTESQKEKVLETRQSEIILSHGSTLQKPHADPKAVQDKVPVVSVKSGALASGPYPSSKVTPSKQYTRIAPAKIATGTPTYVLPPASGYVQASPNQTFMGTPTANITPTGNMLPVFGNQNQSVFQTGGGVYLKQMASCLEVKAPTIQLSHGNRSLVSQVNNAACVSVPPLFVLSNNILPGVPTHQDVYGHSVNLDRNAFTEVGGIKSRTAAGIASKSANHSHVDQKFHIDQRHSTNIKAEKSAFLPGADGGVQATKSRQAETAGVHSTPHGLLGYINVPVIKDDQGRLVMILPNDKTIMGSTQIKQGEVGKVPSKDVEVVPRDSVTHLDLTQTKQSIRTNVRPEVSRHQQPSGLQKEQYTPQINTPQLKYNVSSVAAHPSLDFSKAIEGKSGRSEQNVKATNNERQSTQVPSVITDANDDEEVQKKTGDDAAKSSTSTLKKTLEKTDVGNKNEGSFQSKSTDDLRARQRAITAKLRELRSVRVLIAKHGRMEEVECMRMVERLKQVEDLFFRQLIATSKELDDRFKTENQGKKMDAKEVKENAAFDSVQTKGDNGLLSSDQNSTTSKTAASKVKKSDETVDKLFNTAHLLRNCINAMAKKRHTKHGKVDVSAPVGNREIHIHEQREQRATEVVRKSKGVKSKETDSETPQDTQIHNASSTSTVSTEQESDMSIGSPQRDQYHLQLPNTNTEASTDKIVLRLQRVRNRDDSSSTSMEDAQNTKLPGSKNETVYRDKTPPLKKGPSNPTGYEINGISNTNSSGHAHINDGSNQSRTATKVDESKSTFQVATSGSKVECSRNESNDSGTFCRNKVGIKDDSSTGSEGRQSKAQHVSSKQKKYAVFTGPTKEQLREEDIREREMVKEAWNRVFPSPSPSETRYPCSNREHSSSSESEQHTVCSKPRGQTLQVGGKNKHVKHVHGNPVIRGNLASIGNINVTRQVGGSSETKFQWLLKQLQKKRSGGAQLNQKDQLRMQTPVDSKVEDGREYVSLISRGVQTRSRKVTGSGFASISRKANVTRQEEKKDDKENVITEALLPGNHNRSSGNHNKNTKKRGRESTGSGGKPQEKLPRIRSPTSNVESTGLIDQNDDLQDLISLREEVLSRQSTSSEDTVEYNDNFISVEENVRRLKPLEKEKKKLRSTGTMTTSESVTDEKSSMKPSKASTSRKFATKTRGHGTYGWCKKKIASKISKEKGSRKSTKSATTKTKAKAKTTPAKRNAVFLISDDSLQEQSEEESLEKEKFPQKTRRNTLASLSARLWDECYWSTINDTNNPDVGAAKNICPSNKSPPTTRRTGLESKMLGLWSDLLRYSGNHHDVDTLPATLHDLDRLDLPPAIASSMKILLEGYDMVKQGSSLANEDSKSSIDPQIEATLNENNSAGIHVMQHNESAQKPWEGPITEEKDNTTDTSPSYDEESQLSSSTWEASMSTQFTLDTLTSHSADTVGSGPTYHSSSATESPPSLSTEDEYVPMEEPETNLRRWTTRIELTSGTGVNGSISPDYSADVMNMNDPHEEGDSGRSGSERADAVAVGTLSGWQISGAGDLREPRLLTVPKTTARNRRRQNRVMSWPNIIHEEEDSDEDIPLAKLIEKERLKRLQKEAAKDDHPPETLPEEVNTENLDKETIPSSPESELPGPFLLSQSQLGEISTDSRVMDTVAEKQHNYSTVSTRNDVGEDKGPDQGVHTEVHSHPRMEQSDDNLSERPEEHITINPSSEPEPVKKSGKFLYGNSKKGKSLVKKHNRSSQELSRDLSSNSSDAAGRLSGRRFVVSCSQTTEGVSDGNHLYYRNDSSPDIFDRM